MANRGEVHWLVVESPLDGNGKRIDLRDGQPITIGKSPDRTIRCDGPLVSRRHAQLLCVDGVWRIEDLKSTNGTFVNDRRIEASELNHGDRVRIGEFTLQYFAAQADDEPAWEDEEQDDEPAWVDDAANVADDAVEALPETIIQAQEKVGVTCDGCDQPLSPKARYCTHCGINVKTGRPLVISTGKHAQEVHEVARAMIAPVSWFIPFGFNPVGSTAYAARKPIAIMVIAAITIPISAVFYIMDMVQAPQMRSAKYLMLWIGDQDPDAEQLEAMYMYTSYGDREAYIAAKEQLAETTPPEDLPVAAHRALPQSQRATGAFRWYQLLTNTFLHGGFWHLLGNLVFMLIFGWYVNGSLGNTATLIIYPLLGVCASAIWAITAAHGPTSAALGASGAIMGLAGMYLIFFPIQRMFMSVWLRLLFKLFTVVFSVRGFWVLLFYVGMDVLSLWRNADDGVAHWAHLGGFIAGVVVALTLLLLRMVNVQGDLPTVLLGRRIWRLLGRPGDRRETSGVGLGVFARLFEQR